MSVANARSLGVDHAMVPPRVSPDDPTSPELLTDSATAIAERMQSAIELFAPGAQMAIDVVDNNTGAELASHEVDQQFYTASVVKLLIALDTLERQDWQPNPATAEQIRQMLSASDDTIADTLWVAGGANTIIGRMVDTVGLTGTQPPDDPSQWGETRTTARDVVAVYHYLNTMTPEPARNTILEALSQVSETAADGTNQYFGIPAAMPGVSWAVKPGWMTVNSTTTLNTTGMIAGGPGDPLRYTVVVLSSLPGTIDWAAGGMALTAGVAALHSVLPLSNQVQ